MNEQENVRIVRALFDNLNARNLDASDPYIAEDFQAMAPGWTSSYSRDQVKATLEGLNTAFPDGRYEVRDLIAQGEKAAATWELTGTHTSPLQTPGGDTIPPTNKKVRLGATTIYEFRAGKIIRQETYFDQVALLSQLGVFEAAQGRV